MFQSLFTMSWFVFVLTNHVAWWKTTTITFATTTITIFSEKNKNINKQY